MVSSATVLAVLLAFPPAVSDCNEPEDMRRERLQPLAADIATASDEARWRGDRRDLAALLVTIAWHETRVAAEFQFGERQGLGHARGPWQIELGSRLAGDPLRASTPAELLARSWQCGAGPRGWLTAYAGVRCGVEWRGLAPRVRTFYWVRARLH
jgi:hypothetical protein